MNKALLFITLALLVPSLCFACPSCGGAGKAHSGESSKEDKHGEKGATKHVCDCKGCQEGKHECGDTTKGCSCADRSDKPSCEGDSCAKE